MINPLLAFSAWLVLVALLFLVLRPRRAVLVSYIVGWLFLPFSGFYIEGLPVLGKVAITGLGVLCAALVFDAGSFIRFRPSWLDAPVVVWCIVPFISSVLNDLGPKDGILEVFNVTVAWGLPYFIGRVYFDDLEGIRELAIGILIGGLIYIPFCMWELRMGPRLHKFIYGFHTGRSAYHIKFGGYRPRVFMHSGLSLGMWMTAASLIAVWFWATGVLKRLLGVPMVALVPTLLVATVVCRALGAILLLAGGIGALLGTKSLRTSWLIVALALVPAAYIPLRTLNLWSGEPVVTIVRDHIDPARAGSFAFRLDQEDILVERALERPIFGWAGWGRNRAIDERGRRTGITDGMWVIALGRHGLVGLVAFMGTLMLPAAALFWRTPVPRWSDRAMAAPIALATLILLFSIDNLMNAKLNPIFMVVVGGIATVSARSCYRRGNPLAYLLHWLTSSPSAMSTRRYVDTTHAGPRVTSRAHGRQVSIPPEADSSCPHKRPPTR